MISSLAISDATLAFASIFSVFLMAQQKAFIRVHRASCTMAMYGFLLIATAAILGCLRYGFSSYWAASHDLATGIATFLAPPIVGAALCLGLLLKSWSKTVWAGGIVLVCMLYGISDWFGVERFYRDAELAIALVLTLYCILRSQMNYGPKLMILSAIASYFIGGLIIGNQGTLLGYLRLDLFRYFMGLGNLLLSSGMYLAFRVVYPQPEH
ncbi:hypothetical protein [Candidatus Sororendozoicomonas aggregata]|uniref:hypothetical protein n=1 Tax=Candidatus Sororendozoicomonas aggregata TaxID=3073239 RepID=UPI002ED642FF